MSNLMLIFVVAINFILLSVCDQMLLLTVIIISVSRPSGS